MALVAIAAKAVLPTGFMFSQSPVGQGQFIEICSSSGLKTIAVSAKTGAPAKRVPGEERPAPTADHEALCSFAFAASINGPAPVFTGIVFMPANTSLKFAQAAQDARAPSHLSRHLTRAPPFIS